MKTLFLQILGMMYTDFKNVLLILVKSAPKKVIAKKTVLPIGKLVKCQKNLFFGQSFFFFGGGGAFVSEKSQCVFSTN